MAIPHISANSLYSNPTHPNPRIKAEQAATVPQAQQEARRTDQAAKTDTVTISRQALQMLAKNGNEEQGPRETRDNRPEEKPEKK